MFLSPDNTFTRNSILLYIGTNSIKCLSSVQSLSHVWLFETPWTAMWQASLSITNSRSLFELMSNTMPFNHSSSVIPFSSCLQSFPTSRSFPMNWFFTSRGQSTGVSASASVLLMNTQDWSPLGWTGWISLQSKRLSRVFSNTTVQKHQFFRASLVAPLVKNLPAMRELWVWPLGWEDLLEKERLPTLVFWPREFYEQYSPQRVGHNWMTFTCVFLIDIMPSMYLKFNLPNLSCVCVCVCVCVCAHTHTCVKLL